MIRSLLISLLFVSWFNGLAQVGEGDSVTISFRFTKSAVVDSNGLILKVIYHNNNNHAVDIYNAFTDGDLGDRFANISIKTEKLKGEKYVRDRVVYYCSSPFSYSDEDSLRHYDLPKRKLAAYATDTIPFNLLSVGGSFVPGKYRFKVHVRVKTIRNNTPYKVNDGSRLPPEDDIKYLASGWLYLTVKKYIPKTMYNDDGTIRTK
ncbi:MAG: hypothetical protein QM731_09600 [Chitinophagaceae bacterium]